tara:strand:+ start:85 stop:285 length:201 start_codon:yes stop_codon:yes gene_type:complete
MKYRIFVIKDAKTFHSKVKDEKDSFTEPLNHDYYEMYVLTLEEAHEVLTDKGIIFTDEDLEEKELL